MEEFYKFQRLSLNNLGCRSTDDRLNRNDTVYIIYVYVFRVARASTPGWVKLSGSSKRIAPNTTRSLTRWDPSTEKLPAQVKSNLNFVILTEYWRSICYSIIIVKRNSNKKLDNDNPKSCSPEAQILARLVYEKIPCFDSSAIRQSPYTWDTFSFHWHVP